MKLGVFKACSNKSGSRLWNILSETGTNLNTEHVSLDGNRTMPSLRAKFTKKLKCVDQCECFFVYIGIDCIYIVILSELIDYTCLI